MISFIKNTFKQKVTSLDIVWRNVWLLGLLHLGALYGFYLKFGNVHLWTKLFGVFYCQVSGLGVTAGRHRYFCHRAFKGNRFVDILLMIMACTLYEQSIYTWVRDHRLHHKHSETNADPYNSNRGFFFSHMGWVFVKKQDDVKEKGKSINMSDLKSNPVVMFEYKYNLPLAFVFTFLIPTLIPWVFWNEKLLNSFFYCTLYRFIILLHITWCVNSFAHIYGMRNYDKKIKPSENPYVSMISMGEGFHNYHHTFPWDYKAAELGNDFRNFTTFFIDFLAYCGWVTDRKTVTKELLDSRIQRTGKPEEKASRNTMKSIVFYVVFLFIFI